MAAMTLLASAAVLGACEKSEPPIPATDPMQKVDRREGWRVGKGVAIGLNDGQLKAHHIQAIASNLHDIDFDTPPASLLPVPARCTVARPDPSAQRFLVIGTGRSSFPLMKNTSPPGLSTIQAAHIRFNADFVANNRVREGMNRHASHGRTMGIRDIFVTEPGPVHLTIASPSLGLTGTTHNIIAGPDTQIVGVAVYTTAGSSSVMGVSADTPVSFVSEANAATERCWTRMQARPDDSWAKGAAGRNNARRKALAPHWKASLRRVSKDVGRIDNDNVVSFNSAGHILIGPAPTTYETRLPYRAFAEQTVHFMASDYVNFGDREANDELRARIIASVEASTSVHSSQ